MDREDAIDRLPIGGDDEQPHSNDEESPDRRQQAQKLLLGVSVAGTVVAVLAAAVRRLLGQRDTDEDDEIESDSESTTEPETPAPDAEAIAAVIGLAFQVLVRALVGEDESESPTV